MAFDTVTTLAVVTVIYYYCIETMYIILIEEFTPMPQKMAGA